LLKSLKSSGSDSEKPEELEENKNQQESSQSIADSDSSLERNEIKSYVGKNLKPK
jgi:hypothetical protein